LDSIREDTSSVIHAIALLQLSLVAGDRPVDDVQIIEARTLVMKIAQRRSLNECEISLRDRLMLFLIPP
jgi:hypothetical protein